MFKKNNSDLHEVNQFIEQIKTIGILEVKNRKLHFALHSVAEELSRYINKHPSQIIKEYMGPGYDCKRPIIKES